MADEVIRRDERAAEPEVARASEIDEETVAGTAIGAAGGAAVGAVVGAVAGPVGALVGGVVGGLAGGAAGAATTTDDGTVPTTSTPITGNSGYGAEVDTGITGVGVTPQREVP